VVDSFAGSGTTGVAAHGLGRKAVLCDTSPVAIAVARARLLREKASLSVERIVGTAPPRAEGVKVEVKNDRVRLVEPAEPLAWAVGTCERDVFRPAWHAERVPGARPVPAERDAHLPRRRDLGRDLWVRVFCDDGSVGSCRVDAPRRERRTEARS
jgi:hypothetical protein